MIGEKYPKFMPIYCKEMNSGALYGVALVCRGWYGVQQIINSWIGISWPLVLCGGFNRKSNKS